MTHPLDFTCMLHTTHLSETLRSLITRYSRQSGTVISYHEIDYETGWSEFMRMALHTKSPDLSEMGSTWVNDFAAMEALRPFSPGEVSDILGNESAVLARASLGAIWSIPWTVDVRLVFYRRDLLAKAGVSEDGAFSTPERFEATLSSLQAAGIASPWSYPTKRSYLTLHNLAPWVWYHGGDFVTPDGKATLINQPEAMAGIRAYFGLGRFLSPQARGLSETENDAMFLQGGSAVTLSGPWLLVQSRQYPEVAQNIGLATPLGSTYLGGSNLILWKQSPRVREALALISMLLSKEAQVEVPPVMGLLPARQEALETFPVPDTALYPLLRQAVQSGRSLPMVPLWGRVEDRLVNMLAALWSDLLASPATADPQPTWTPCCSGTSPPLPSG